MAAILGRLRELALQRPVLLVLEDAHWVDPSTLELLGLLAAALPRLPVLLVVTSRVADTGQAWLPEIGLSREAWDVHVDQSELAKLGRRSLDALRNFRPGGPGGAGGPAPADLLTTRRP